MKDNSPTGENASMVIMVTGATRGIGRAVATEMARRGHTVYGGGRSWAEQADEVPFKRLDIDVNDDESVKAAVGRILDEHGRVDVLINNAGVSHCGPVEETPPEKVKNLFETNYFGILRTILAVLPSMRLRGAGTIVNVGSAAGKIGVPFQSHYSASKFAVEGLTESLRYELLPFGIRVILIEPGDVMTDIWNKTPKPPPESSAYRNALARFLKVKEKEMGGQATPVETVAKDIADIVLSDTSRLRHPVAKMAGVFLFLRKILPDSLFFWGVSKNYGI